MRVVSQQGDTVDSICWQVYGQTSGMVERVLQANRRLASLPAILPVGTVIEMPDQPAVTEEKPQIQLWD